MKKFILGLFVFLWSVISFWYCDTIYQWVREQFTLLSWQVFPFSEWFCLQSSSYTNQLIYHNSNWDFVSTWFIQSNGLFCTDFDWYLTSISTTLRTYYYYSWMNWWSSDCPLCPVCPTCSNYYVNLYNSDWTESSTLIQSDLNLYVNSWVSLSTDIVWDYIFSSDWSCSDNSWVIIGSWDWSALFINWIQHEGKWIINVNIADWVVWDYSFNDDQFDLDIGSGYDQDYIDGVIDVQSYRPTSEDFTQTFVGGLILFTPYVIILLFVILVWKLIQRIFKSK